ncbi:MAG: hypothetical protein C0467_19600 [Planctomycetaceae bacterium]|nr:hypothetical protein [Planctomycetaceae bacterium]
MIVAAIRLGRAIEWLAVDHTQSVGPGLLVIEPATASFVVPTGEKPMPFMNSNSSCTTPSMA